MYRILRSVIYNNLCPRKKENKHRAHENKNGVTFYSVSQTFYEALKHAIIAQTQVKSTTTNIDYLPCFTSIIRWFVLQIFLSYRAPKQFAAMLNVKNNMATSSVKFEIENSRQNFKCETRVA